MRAALLEHYEFTKIHRKSAFSGLSHVDIYNYQRAPPMLVRLASTMIKTCQIPPCPDMP